MGFLASNLSAAAGPRAALPATRPPARYVYSRAATAHCIRRHRHVYEYEYSCRNSRERLEDCGTGRWAHCRTHRAGGA